MYLCLGLSEFSPETLAFAKQLGVDYVKICGGHLMGVTQQGVLPADELQALQEKLDQFGLSLAVVLLPQGRDTQYWNARLGRPERDQEIDDVCETIRVIAAAGVPVVEWTWSIPDVWGSISGDNDWGRGGARVRRFDYDLVKDVPAYAGEAVEADEMWERLEYFLTRIVPVAEEAGVRLALHPHDPPTPYLRGEARILNSFEGMKRLVELVPSEVNGLNFCQGTVAEMGIDVIGAIRYFGERDKLNHVHFRNVKGSVPRFDESFVDDGDTDMLEAVRAYHEVGYRYAMMPDHTPHIAGDSPYGHRGRAYAIGYMRALMQAVGAVES